MGEINSLEEKQGDSDMSFGKDAARASSRSAGINCDKAFEKVRKPIKLQMTDLATCESRVEL